MKKLLFLIAVALLTSIATMAQPRSEQQAIQIAQDFFAKSTKKKAPKLSVVPQQKVTQQIRKKVASAKKAPSQYSSCYIINDEANNRFVIVSADERLYKILGYSNNGCFDVKSVPDGLINMIAGYNKQYDYLLKNGNHVIRTTTTYKEEAIEPLIQTKWDQFRPYFNDCPIDTAYEKYYELYPNIEKLYENNGGNIRCVTGCVATAMAQIMNYHQYPEHGEGRISYYTGEGIRQALRLDTVYFDWQNMVNEYDKSFNNNIQKEAVAKLMHACGVSVHMNYAYNGSGAADVDVAYALTHYFKYNPNIKCYLRDYFPEGEWNALIKKDLQDGLPVFYEGQTKTYDEEGNVIINPDGLFSTAGHAFIIDGYDENSRYHINWGYSGENDGYFSLDALSFKDSVNFELDQGMICNISPKERGVYEDCFYTTSFYIRNLTLSNYFLGFNIGEDVTLDVAEVSCYSLRTNTYNNYFGGEFGFGLYDLNFNFIKSLYKNSYLVGSFYGRTCLKKDKVFSCSFTIDASTFADGKQYIIAPYVKSGDHESPTIIRTKDDQDWFLVTVESNRVKFRKEEPVTLYISSMSTKPGETISIPINMINDKTIYNGFQFDIELPDGFSIIEEDVTSTERCVGEDQRIKVIRINENVYRICFTDITISMGEGTIANISLSVDSSVRLGDYSLNLLNINLIKPIGKWVLIDAISGIIKVDNTVDMLGDANGDDVVDVADIVYIVNNIMESPTADFIFKNADMNGDGEIDVADITLVVKLIMESSVKAYKPSMLSAQLVDFAVNASGEYTLSVKDAGHFVASQFDVIISDGAALEDIAMNQKGDHQLVYTPIGDNRYRVLTYSPSNEPLDKDILTIRTKGNDNIVSIENALFVHQNGEKLAFEKLSGQATGLAKISDGYQGRSIYSIDGREISYGNLSKGMYIINGKKHIVK